jgi:hypothetical protein
MRLRRPRTLARFMQRVVIKAVFFRDSQGPDSTLFPCTHTTLSFPPNPSPAPNAKSYRHSAARYIHPSLPTPGTPAYVGRDVFIVPSIVLAGCETTAAARPAISPAPTLASACPSKSRHELSGRNFRTLRTAQSCTESCNNWLASR